jgi:predicted hydrocarbon binding protein
MMICAKRLFDFTEEDFREWGKFGEKSLLIRLFMKYFVSIERVAKEAPRMWRHNLTVGDINVIEINKEKKSLILKLENFTILPCYCQALSGYFSSIVQMVVGKEVICEETKCVHKGDDYHEFLLEW